MSRWSWTKDASIPEMSYQMKNNRFSFDSYTIQQIYLYVNNILENIVKKLPMGNSPIGNLTWH